MAEVIEPGDNDVSNLDDASAYYGLDHSAEGRTTGGIRRFFDEQEREHKESLRREKLRQGVDDTQKLQAVNAGAYDDVEERTRELQAQGLSLLEATRIAREEAARPKPAAETEQKPDYMGDSTENLMAHESSHGGGGGNVTKTRSVRVYLQCNKCNGRGFIELYPTNNEGPVERPKCPACKGKGEVFSHWQAESVQLIGAKSSGSGSSSSVKMKRKKRGGAQDPNEGVVLASYDARTETIESEPRDKKRDARVTEQTDKALDEIEAETGLNVPALLAAIANLREKGDPQSVFTLRTLFNAAPERKRQRQAS